MPVTDVQKDIDNLTLTITAEFAAPVERVWQVYADPRQLEKVWGPPTYPATVVDHSLTPGGRVTYFMTAPEGEKFAAWMEIVSVDEPHGFAFRDGFADADFNPVDSMPVSTNEYRFESSGEGTRAVYTTSYETAEDMQTVLDMGVLDGTTSAINQIDDLLAA